MIIIEDENCSWCGYPGATHEAGTEIKQGPISGIFCNKECFRLWVQWNYSWEQYLIKKEQKKEQPENEV